MSTLVLFYHSCLPTDYSWPEGGHVTQVFMCFLITDSVKGFVYTECGPTSQNCIRLIWKTSGVNSFKLQHLLLIMFTFDLPVCNEWRFIVIYSPRLSLCKCLNALIRKHINWGHLGISSFNSWLFCLWRVPFWFLASFPTSENKNITKCFSS